MACSLDSLILWTSDSRQGCIDKERAYIACIRRWQNASGYY